jgi:hypothetical protein
MGNGHVNEALHVFYFLCTLRGNTLSVELSGININTAVQNRGDPDEREKLQLLRDSEQTPAVPGYV